MRHARTLSRADELKVLLGFAVQPFVAAFFAFITFPVVDYTSRYLRGGRPADPLDAALSFATAVDIAGVVMTALGALPTLASLLQRGPVSAKQILTSGAVLGNVPGVLIAVLTAATQGVNWHPICSTVSRLW